MIRALKKMNYKIQSDKSVKIFIKINVITNINFDYDISLDSNENECKKFKIMLLTTKHSRYFRH